LLCGNGKTRTNSDAQRSLIRVAATLGLCQKAIALACTNCYGASVTWTYWLRKHLFSITTGPCDVTKTKLGSRINFGLLRLLRLRPTGSGALSDLGDQFSEFRLAAQGLQVLVFAHAVCVLVAGLHGLAQVLQRFLWVAR
jgi:hypothetical protein